MAPTINSLHVVGEGGNQRRAAALAASEQTQRGRAVRQSPDLAAALLAPDQGLELLVLLEPRPDEIAAAECALDARGLPRWALVPASAADAVAPEFAAAEWRADLLVPAFRSAARVLALRRENARLRGDLVTIGRRVIHDLRTPLSSIALSSEALRDPASAADDAHHLHDAVAAALNEAGSLLTHVGGVLLATARPIVLQPVAMGDVVWSALQKLDARVRSANARIDVADTWPVVTGVPALLELVWTHLVSNSLQHAGPNLRIELGWNPSGAETCFWVRDSGPGVAAAVRSRLFHPLDRLNELNAPRGYGLPLVQRLVELQFGRTAYDSAPAPGGTFSFTLR